MPNPDRAVRRLNETLRQFGVELFAAAPETLGYGTTQERSLRNTLLRTLARAGYGVRRPYARDLPDEIVATIESVRPYTMTSQTSIAGLCESVEYLVRNDVGGAVVECGVWRGGSVMAIARTLLRLGAGDRDLYLFDTFAGMTMPDERDQSLTAPGQAPLERWRRDDRGEFNEWAYAPLEAVRAGVLGTGYPPERVHLIQGPVEETLPAEAPEQIALLRLDTDWYASTKHELEHLYPRLEAGGVLILDDYGSWAGARQAADEYEPLSRAFLARLDAFARIAIKPAR